MRVAPGARLPTFPKISAHTGFAPILAAVLCGGLLAWTIRLSGLHIARVSSNSMAPAVRAGDWVLEQDLTGDATAWVRRGDIVVFSFPIGSERRAIKRVAGLPGDRITIRERSVSINGLTIPISGSQGEGAGLRRVETVPASTLFLLGDNAANSIDSRQFGAVPQRQVFGRVLLLLHQWAVWLGLGLAATVAIWALRLTPQLVFGKSDTDAS